VESEASDSGALMVMVLFGRAYVPLGVAAFAVSFSVVEKV
jgi:hypothetical protein